MCAKSTDTDTKKAFLISLKELLRIKSEEERSKYDEIVRRIFSNLTSGDNFPEMGNENMATEYIAKCTNVPFEDMEMLGLKVIKQLLNWEWGMRALYRNSFAVAYVLNRAVKAKNILEMKYKVVDKTLKSKYFLKSSNVIDPVIGEQLEVYYSKGIYGVEGGPSFVPEYASKSF